MSGSPFAAGEPATPAASGPIYHDRHETSLPLLLLGAVLTVCVAAQLGWPGAVLIGVATDWATGVALTIAFAILWLTFRRRANKAGMRRRAPAFGFAAIVGLVVILPPVVVVLVYAGPFAVLGPGLLTAGVSLRNRFLIVWAAVVGAIGVFEGFFGITNRLPTSVWADWDHAAIYFALGVFTVIAGTVMHVRETWAGSG